MPAAAATSLDSRFRAGATTPAWRAFNLGAGLAVSSVIFFGIAHSRRLGLERPSPPMDDILSISLTPTPPPPPAPAEQRYEDGGPAPNSVQLDTSPAASSVRIEAVPVVVDPVAGPVIRAVAVIPTDFSPHLARDNMEFESSHIWETTQVDQRPVVLWRKAPDIPGELYRSIKNPRITLIFVVNVDGSVENLHIEHSVEPTFDQLMTDAIKEWQFTPAIKKGRKVRCWLQQEIYVKSAQSNPFQLN
jgi:protein TonB